MSSAVLPVKIIPGKVKAIPGLTNFCSPSRRNHCSPSPRNRVHLQPGMIFTFTPESRSPCPGIPSRKKRVTGVFRGASQLRRNDYEHARFQPGDKSTTRGFVKQAARKRWTEASNLLGFRKFEGFAIDRTAQSEGQPSDVPRSCHVRYAVCSSVRPRRTLLLSQAECLTGYLPCSENNDFRFTAKYTPARTGFTVGTPAL